MIHPKVGAAAVGGAIAAVVIAILNQSGVDVTVDLGTSISLLAATAAGYLMPGTSSEDKTPDDSALDPMFHGLPVDAPGELRGDPQSRPAADPRDAQIAELRAQLTAAQTPAVPS